EADLRQGCVSEGSGPSVQFESRRKRPPRDRPPRRRRGERVRLQGARSRSHRPQQYRQIETCEESEVLRMSSRITMNSSLRLLSLALFGLVAFTPDVQAQSALPAGVERVELTVDGVSRVALVYAPASAKTERTPVVFGFHGHGGTAA